MCWSHTLETKEAMLMTALGLGDTLGGTFRKGQDHTQEL